MAPARSSPSALDFAALLATMREKPMHEAFASTPGDSVAALGFLLAISAQWNEGRTIVWVGADVWIGEEGALSPRGLSAFGLDLDHFLAVETHSDVEGLWAAEQALSVEGALVVATLPDRAIDLKASRRLLLQAERSHSRALLLRAGGNGAMPSGAHTRWRVAAGPSQEEGRLVGRPSFDAQLVRQRGGPAGLTFALEWDGHERAFRDREHKMARAVVSTPRDGSIGPPWRRTG